MRELTGRECLIIACGPSRVVFNSEMDDLDAKAVVVIFNV